MPSNLILKLWSGDFVNQGKNHPAGSSLSTGRIRRKLIN